MYIYTHMYTYTQINIYYTCVEKLCSFGSPKLSRIERIIFSVWLNDYTLQMLKSHALTHVHIHTRRHTELLALHQHS